MNGRTEAGPPGWVLAAIKGSRDKNHGRRFWPSWGWAVIQNSNQKPCAALLWIRSPPFSFLFFFFFVFFSVAKSHYEIWCDVKERLRPETVKPALYFGGVYFSSGLMGFWGLIIRIKAQSVLLEPVLHFTTTTWAALCEALPSNLWLDTSDSWLIIWPIPRGARRCDDALIRLVYICD